MRKTGTCLLLVFYLACRGARAQEGLLPCPQAMDRTLENGLRVLLIEHHEQPTTSFYMLIKAGKIDDPLDRAGLAELTAQMLREGTASRSSYDVTEQLAQMGAQFSISSHARYTLLKLGTLNPYAPAGLDLFADLLRCPCFPGRELKQVKRDIVNTLKLEQTYAQGIATQHLHDLLFGRRHALGRATTVTSVKGLRLGHVKAFYGKHIRPNNSILLVIGDFAAEDMMARIQDHLGPWTPGDLEADMPAPRASTGPGRFRVVHKPEATQAFIHLNQWAPPCHHPDYPAYRLMNYILGGGGFSSRLMEAVRSQGGKTYDIRSTYTANSDYGVVTLQTATRNQAFLGTYRLIRSVLDGLIAQGITATELHEAQAYYAGALRLQWETPDTTALKVLTASLNGFTLADMAGEVDRLQSVQVDEVNRVLRAGLHPDRFNVVVVGDARALADALAQIGPYEKVSCRSLAR